MDLTSIKNKAKRLEYFNLDMFMADMEMILNNSVTFNGQDHQVTKLAFDLVNHAIQKVNERRDDIESLQMLVKEKLEQGFLRSTPLI
jgi:Bromodomain